MSDAARRIGEQKDPSRVLTDAQADTQRTPAARL